MMIIFSEIGKLYVLSGDFFSEFDDMIDIILKFVYK